MVKLYVLPSPAEQAALEAGVRPRMCLVREFDGVDVAQAYLKGLRGGRGTIIRESHLEVTVAFVSDGLEVERPFVFDTVEEKVAFRQGLDDNEVEGMEAPVAFSEGARLFPFLERLYAADPELVFVKCEEGLLGLLKSFGAKPGVYDAVRGGVLTEASAHVLSQIEQFPADFEIDRDVSIDAASSDAVVERVTSLMFLRSGAQGRAKNIGLLSVRTVLPTDADVMASLVDATTEWVRKTDAGSRLWVHSREDLNIGDLAHGRAFDDPMLIAAMRQRGIDFIACAVSGAEEALAFDKVLVDPAGLKGERQYEIAFAEV